MARGNRMREIRSKGVTVLAWTSLVAAVIAGPLIAATFIGELVRFLLNIIPWAWAPVLALVVLLVMFVRDLIMDGEPNHQAIYSLLAAPSIATATEGKLASKIGEWTSAALNVVGGTLSEWLGTSGAVGLALAVAATSLLLAQRAVKKSPGVGMAH